MSKFTEGPWIADGISVRGPQKVHVCGGTGEVVKYRNSFAIGNGWGSLSQRTIDANLIAAAPQLYEACRKAKKLLESMPTKDPEFTVFYDIVAALAKADGAQ